MRGLLVAAAGLLAAGCTSLTVGPADTSSQSELDRRAAESCDHIPNTDEMLACRRDAQDSWRNRPAGGSITFPPTSAQLT